MKMLNTCEVTESLESSFLFTKRCKSLPVFNSTMYWLNNNYNRIKDINCVTKFSMKLAETTVKSSIYLANPFVEKFKDSVTVLDNIACSQLDRLEAAFPILHSDNLVDESKFYINKNVKTMMNSMSLLNLYESKIKGVDMLKNSATNVAKRLFQLSQDYMEESLIETKNTFDSSISSEEIAKLKTMNDEHLSERLRILSAFLYHVVKKKCLSNIEEIIKLLDKYLVRIISLLDILDDQKREMTMLFQKRFELARQQIILYKDYFDVLQKQLIVRDGRSLENVYSLEERVKILVRRSLGNCLTASYLCCSVLNTIPSQVKSSFLSTFNEFHKTYSNFIKDESLNLSINDYESIIQSTKNLLIQLIKAILHSKMINSMTPNFDIFGVLHESEEESAIAESIQSEMEIQNEDRFTAATCASNENIDDKFTSNNSSLNLSKLFNISYELNKDSHEHAANLNSSTDSTISSKSIQSLARETTSSNTNSSIVSDYSDECQINEKNQIEQRIKDESNFSMANEEFDTGAYQCFSHESDETTTTDENT